MFDSEESSGSFRGVRLGRFWLSAEKVVIGSIGSIALILGVGFLISLRSNRSPATQRCSEISSFSLGQKETKSFTLNNGSRAVVAVTSADSGVESGTLMVGEQIEPISLSPGSSKEWNGVRLNIVGTNKVGGRTLLSLVAEDCSSPTGTK
jgi:hypothetical protein